MLGRSGVRRWSSVFLGKSSRVLRSGKSPQGTGGSFLLGQKGAAPLGQNSSVRGGGPLQVDPTGDMFYHGLEQIIHPGPQLSHLQNEGAVAGST